LAASPSLETPFLRAFRVVAFFAFSPCSFPTQKKLDEEGIFCDSAPSQRSMVPVTFEQWLLSLPSEVFCRLHL